MTSRSQLISPEHKPGKAIGRADAQQVLAADSDGDVNSDDDDMKWLEEPLFASDAEFSEDEKSAKGEEGKPKSVPVDVHPETSKVKGITRPVAMTKAQTQKHYLEGHAN